MSDKDLMDIEEIIETGHPDEATVEKAEEITVEASDEVTEDVTGEVIQEIIDEKKQGNNHSPAEDGYEKLCAVCHRPESVAGKMVDLPNNITVCSDCMQRSFDAMSSGKIDLSKLLRMPGVQFFNMTDLQNSAPHQAKIKKKADPEKKEYPKLDIKDIPPPHKIDARLSEYVIGQE